MVIFVVVFTADLFLFICFERSTIFYNLFFIIRDCSSFKMGSDVSHFNVLFIVVEQSHVQTMSMNHDFGRERRAEEESNSRPSVYQPNALPLDRAG